MENKLAKLKKSGFLQLDNVNLNTLNMLEKKIKDAFDEALRLFNEKDFSLEKFNHFTKRIERGSLDLNCLEERANLLLLTGLQCFCLFSRKINLLSNALFGWFFAFFVWCSTAKTTGLSFFI